jgi:hypothetical protein
MFKPVITAACLCAATSALAEPRRLAGAEITDLVAGATVELDTPIGSKLPVRYTTDGQMSGQARDLASFLGSAHDGGKWWVAGDKLCHKWNRWFDAETQCLSLSKEGRTIHWRSSDGRTGTALVTIAAPPRTVAVATTPRAVAPSPPRVATATAAAPPRAVAAVAAAARPLTVPSTAAPLTVAAAATPPEESAVAYTGVTPRFSRRTTAVATAVNIEAETPAAPALAPEPPPSSESASASESAEVVAVATYSQLGAGRAEDSAGAPVKRAVAARPSRPAAKAETKQPALPTFIVANVSRKDVLNVRNGPSADHDVVGSLSPGSRNVAITGDCQSSWCPVRYESLNGWVKRSFLASDGPAEDARTSTLRDSPEAPRSCLSAKARALVDRIEGQFGPVQLVSTCRAGATIAGTGRPSQHASGNAVDFKAGSRREAIVRWLVANHQGGGTMTYRDMDHIHVDIGRHFVSIAGGTQTASWRGNGRDLPGRMGVGMSAGKSN